MRTLPDLTRIYLYQSFIKTAINTAITVKLLTSKVKLLNTCEKLKMTHEKQLDLGNILVKGQSQAAQSYPVLLITLYLYINSILKIIRKSCVINLLRYIFI